MTIATMMTTAAAGTAPPAVEAAAIAKKNVRITKWSKSGSGLQKRKEAAPPASSDSDKDASEMEEDGPDSVSALSGDSAFYDVLKEAKLECFPTLDDVNPAIVEACNVRTGNYLCIKRSINDRF